MNDYNDMDAESEYSAKDEAGTAQPGNVGRFLSPRILKKNKKNMDIHKYT